jgi:hypothetical protein
MQDGAAEVDFDDCAKKTVRSLDEFSAIGWVEN